MRTPVIFLDTNIFIAENFFDSERINEFFRLSEEGKIRLVTTPVTLIEIRSNFKKHIKAAVELVGNFRKNRASNILKNVENGKNILSVPLHEKKLIEEFNELLEKKLKQAKVQVIPYSEINLEQILNDYEVGNPPFNSSDKKSEFPDAIAIRLIENWCKKKSEVCRILTYDKAFGEYKHPLLKFESDYKAHLSNLLFSEVMDQSLESLIARFESQEDEIKQEIKDWLKDQLDDNTKYYTVSNWLEVHNTNIKNIEVDFSLRDEEHGLFIMSVHAENMRLEIFATIYFAVDIEIDDEDSSVYDSEDKEMMYLDTKTITINRTEYISIIMEYPMDDEEYHSELEIMKINYDKPLEIKSEHRH